MRIGINAVAEPLQKAGTGRYLSGLLAGLSELPADHQYIVFINELNYENFYVDDDRFKYVKLKFNAESAFSRRLFEQVRLPFIAKKHKIEQMLCINNIAPVFLINKCITSVLDIATWVTPERFSPKKRTFLSFYNLASWLTLNFCKQVITISKFSQGQIIEKFRRRTSENTKVIYLGVEEKFRQPISTKQIESAQKKFNINSEYIFSWATIERSKNFERLFEAFKKVGREDLVLVIAGKKSNYWEEILAKIDELEIHDKIIMTDYVTDDELLALLQGSMFVVFPSLYEGAGLPPVEAMAAGKAVVASNSTAIPEYCGNAASFFDPNDTDAMAEKIDKLIAHPEVRQDYERRGLEWSQNFNWKSTAAEVLAILDAVQSEL